MINLEINKINSIINETSKAIENQAKKKYDLSEKLIKQEDINIHELQTAVKNHYLFSEHTKKVCEKLLTICNTSNSETIHILQTMINRLNVINNNLKMQTTALQNRNIDAYLLLYKTEQENNKTTINNYSKKLLKFNIKIPRKIFMISTLIILSILGQINQSVAGDILNKGLPNSKYPAFIEHLSAESDINVQVLWNSPVNLNQDVTKQEAEQLINEGISLAFKMYVKNKQIPNHLIVIIQNIGQKTNAIYSPETNTITISPKFISNYFGKDIRSAIALSVIFHEAIHFIDYNLNPRAMKTDKEIMSWIDETAKPASFIELNNKISDWADFSFFTEQNAFENAIGLLQKIDETEFSKDNLTDFEKKSKKFLEKAIQENHKFLIQVKTKHYTGIVDTGNNLFMKYQGMFNHK